MFIEIGVVILGFLVLAVLSGQFWIWSQLIAHTKELTNLKTLLEKEDRDKLIKTLETNLDLLRQSSILASKQKEYKQFFSVILESIQEDTKWLRSGLFQRFGEVPEYMDINSQIIAFENKVEQIKLTLKEYRMLDNYDE